MRNRDAMVPRELLALNSSTSCNELVVSLLNNKRVVIPWKPVSMECHLGMKFNLCSVDLKGKFKKRSKQK